MEKHIRIRLALDAGQEPQGMVCAGEASARTLPWAHVLLLTGQERSPRRADREIASTLFCSAGTVRGIRKRFHEKGL